MLKYKYIFQIKYTEAILSTSTRKLLWFEITKTLIVVKKIYCVIYYNFRHTFVPYWMEQFGHGLFTVEWLNQHGALQRNHYWARCTQYVSIGQGS